MAFAYTTGTATDIADWFSTFESWITSTVGWSVQSGSGTTNLVLKSSGEARNYTKLYANIYRGVGVSFDSRVYGQVQNDAAGTKVTTSAIYLEAGSDGIAAFDYWMVADREAIVICFEISGGGSYKTIYVGTLIPFARTIKSEVYIMVAGQVRSTCSILRAYDDVWDFDTASVTDEPAIAGDPPNPKDNSLAISGLCLWSSDELLGQFRHITSNLEASVSIGETIVTGPANNRTNWIVVGYSGASSAIAMRTGGVPPVGDSEYESNFNHVTGETPSPETFISIFEDWIVNVVGWTVESGTGTNNIVISSTGESGTDSIFLNVYSNTANVYMRAYSNAGGSNPTTAIQVAEAGNSNDFPCFYWISADLDCIVITLDQRHWEMRHIWGGKLVPFAHSLPDSTYSVATLGWGTNTKYFRMLRGFDDTWNKTVSETPSGSFIDWSPLLIDGVTTVLSPTTLWSSAPYGIAKYIYQCTYTGAAKFDTVQVGDRIYKFFHSDEPAAIMWAMRIQ